MTSAPGRAEQGGHHGCARGGPSNHRRLPVVPDRPPPGNGGEQTSERARRTPNGRQTLPHAPPLAAGARRGEPGVLWRLPPHRRACEHASPAPLAPIRSGVPRKRWASVLPAPPPLSCPAPLCPPCRRRDDGILPAGRRGAGLPAGRRLRCGGRPRQQHHLCAARRRCRRALGTCPSVLPRGKQVPARLFG